MYVINSSNGPYGGISNASGLRGSVVVHNEHNVPAKFQWQAQEGIDTDTFYAMHPTGESQTLDMTYSVYST